MPTKRQERDRMFQLAFLVSTAAHSILGTCDRLRVACGIVQKKRLRGFGFNGSVSGLPHCDDVGHLVEDGHCIATIHAEDNAILNTDPSLLIGAQAIVTATPCVNCIKRLLQAGIGRVDFFGEYSNSIGRTKTAAMARAKHVPLEQHSVDWADVFQRLFDLLARKGGILHSAGYRLRVTKEPMRRS